MKDIQSYLHSLTWDGTRRLDKWLSTYLGAKVNLETSRSGAHWAVSAVARAFQPGCKADHCLVLEGPQGGGRLADASILGGEFFGSGTSPSDLQGRWIIEISPSSRPASSLPAFLARTSDLYRSPFSKIVQNAPRACVFVLTTSDPSSLKPERRFSPVSVSPRLSLDRLRKDIHQIWAEACVRYHAGEIWWRS